MRAPSADGTYFCCAEGDSAAPEPPKEGLSTDSMAEKRKRGAYVSVASGKCNREGSFIVRIRLPGSFGVAASIKCSADVSRGTPVRAAYRAARANARSYTHRRHVACSFECSAVMSGSVEVTGGRTSVPTEGSPQWWQNLALSMCAPHCVQNMTYFSVARPLRGNVRAYPWAPLCVLA